MLPYVRLKGKQAMKAAELRAKSADELQQELNSLLKAQFSLRMQKATQQLTNTSQLGKVRRDIARVRTVLAGQTKGQGKA
jgi:large subunit ribosomal protein L29